MNTVGGKWKHLFFSAASSSTLPGLHLLAGLYTNMFEKNSGGQNARNMVSVGTAY